MTIYVDRYHKIRRHMDTKVRVRNVVADGQKED
jgi:hypothetical protein